MYEIQTFSSLFLKRKKVEGMGVDKKKKEMVKKIKEERFALSNNSKKNSVEKNIVGCVLRHKTFLLFVCIQ